MDAKTVKETFKNLPKKRKQVLLRVLAGYSKPKIAYELCNGSETAVQQNLRQLYKNFHIRGDRERNLPALISLFARCMPELLSDRIPEVPGGTQQEEAIANKPTVTNLLESDTAPKISIEASSFLEYFSKSIDQLKSKDLDVRIGAISTLGTLAKYSSPSEHWTIMEYLAAFIRSNAPRKEEEEGERSPKIPEDIQAALTVIGRRDPEKDKGVLDLSSTDLRGANFREAELQGINLSAAQLQGADFFQADLRRANLIEANLQEAFLKKANLQEAFLNQAKLLKADCQFANLQEAFLVEANLQKAVLYGADLQGAYLDRANLQEANLGTSKLQRADLRDTHLQEAVLQRAKLQRADLRGTNLQEADLIEADLEGTRLWRANLRGAVLQYANLEGAELWRANLEGADLTDATNLTQQQIDQSTRQDSTTILPNYLTISE